MYKYFFKRLLMIIPILLGVALVIFFILQLTPGDPGTMILGAGGDQTAIDRLNEELGYNRPVLERFFSYLYNVVFKLDFGSSYRTRLPVIDNIRGRIPVSITLAFSTILFASVIGIPIGVLSAVKQYSLLDTVPTVISLFMAALPGFWLGMMMMYFFSLKLGWLPSNGVGSWQHFILPVVSLGLPYAAQELRFTRSSMLETIRQDYVRTARAKGANERLVIWKHALKNALLPVITVTGGNFGVLLGGAVVTESLFNIPGLGSLIITSIKIKDVPTVMGATLILAFIFSLILLGVDLLYAAVDPRIKAKYSK
ncbi:Glutathione transport system permease protein GsiC [bioreactor metagenome]|uniref:Glutathione transport system permease protein GsiC n=1 Tax=bioreactor metagenome TaxID=1076179 RepID=A0A644SYR7_9ZZZZ|nr:ABC transporter permease [Spirochaetia bacterium]VBB39783.1 putative peptide transporter permease subunit: membrane component of ABC superfamily [uncultured Spirochaetota bacterium]HOI23688.1 ABC transporter permease [Spirochaetales bacterium]